MVKLNNILFKFHLVSKMIEIERRNGREKQENCIWKNKEMEQGKEIVYLGYRVRIPKNN